MTLSSLRFAFQTVKDNSKALIRAGNGQDPFNFACAWDDSVKVAGIRRMCGWCRCVVGL
jgi:hypothetical protein